MSHQEMTHEEIRKHVRVYLGVFATLMILTLVTVGVSTLGQRHGWSFSVAVMIAMAVACVKGSLVACYFMHLISEKAMLFGILILCGFFFMVLMLLPVVTVQTTVGVH